MKQPYLFFAMIFLNVSSYSQNKDTIDVCTLLNDRPSVMAFKIPNKKCKPNDKNLDKIKKEIDNRFVINADMIKAYSFLIDKYRFIEMTYQSKYCDTIAILFLVSENKKIIKTKAYKIENFDTDFRMSKTKSEMILYRKVRNGRRHATVSFEFNKAKCQIDCFLDDGLSIW